MEFTDFGNKTVFVLMEISENTEFEEEMLLCPSSKSDTIVPVIKSMLWDALGASRK